MSCKFIKDKVYLYTDRRTEGQKDRRTGGQEDRRKKTWEGDIYIDIATY